jgi:hypothetical protein
MFEHALQQKQITEGKRLGLAEPEACAELRP